MIKTRGNWFFPLILALLMGSVSVWLDRVSQVSTEEIALNPSEPKYRINGISAERFDADGLPGENLTATAAWQLPQQNIVNIDNPQLTLLRQGKPQYQVSSALAQYHTDSREVVFSDNVVLHQSADGSGNEGILNTSSLTVDTATQTAKTDAKVDYRYGLSHGSAVGFEYNKERGFLNLSSRVKAIIYDPNKP